MSTSNDTPRAPVAGATFAVVVLTAMNLLNYIDRWVPSAVKDLIKVDLHLDDRQTALPLSAFLVVYMLASPVFGSLAGRMSRKHLVALGVALWSLATAAAALAGSFTTFLLARAAVGIGEAAYATIAPSILSDFFPPSKRNRVLTLFYVATPVGSALGFVLGGALGQHYGWRAAFLACGLPGLLVALLALSMREPPRGHFDAPEEVVASPTWPSALRALAKNPRYLVAVAGYTLVTFATGGIADWFATYLARERHLELAHADGLVGTATVVGGLGGTIVGGLLADRARRYTKQAYLATSGLAMLPAAALLTVAIYVARSPSAIFASLVAAQIFLWMYNGPINALIVNSVDAGLRARAFGLSIFSIHVLGDALSPPLIGALSDARGGNLSGPFAIVPVTLALGAGVWLVGWRKLAADPRDDL